MGPGTVVKLRSGGPPMTVYEVQVDQMVAVEWFDPQRQLHRDRFRECELKELTDWEERKK